ncbi:MAG: transglutaminase family protein [Beijerinckiaceae bacterium]|jgi:transglutaminase-like putative cysteine protease|nr:transglutaminase family protein [Beijerinckiaceae bacterium]
MRLRLRHETNYDYAEPARGAIQVLRLTPRNHATQFVRRWRVEIDADCRLERDEDAYGNITHIFSIDGPIERMRILVDGEVDTSASSGVVRGSLERFPLTYWTSETPLTAAGENLREFAADLSAQEGGDPFAFLHRLNTTIFENFSFLPGATDTATSAEDVFQHKKGVCQDFAQVFLAAARHLGIPARYVSGYFLRTDTERQEAGHAWAEAHIAGIGWVGFDPAHGLCSDERYIRLATGRDYLEAAPIRGSRLGGQGESLSVLVSLHEGREIKEQ